MSIILVQSSVLNLLILSRKLSDKCGINQAQTWCFRSVKIGKSSFEKEISPGPVINFDRTLRGPMCGGKRGRWKGGGTYILVIEQSTEKRPEEKVYRWSGWDKEVLQHFGKAGEKCKNGGNRGIKY